MAWDGFYAYPNGATVVSGSTPCQVYQDQIDTFPSLSELNSLTWTGVTWSYDGYTLVSWNTSADGTGTNYLVGGDMNQIGSNIHPNLYAIWEPDSGGGGDVTDTISISYGDTKIHTATAPETFTLNTEGKFMTDDIVIAPWVPDPDVDNNSWEDISRVASAGTAASYWSVGDTKKVHLQGTIGTLSLNTDLYVFIIGINHRDVNGITWQGFKAAKTNGIDVCLVDSNYTFTSSDGSKYFNMNHWGSDSSTYNTNYGGWKGCDIRYDILGSTNVAPSGYGATPTTSRVGYDAGTSTATNPVANTLMSCLPSDLRAVMKSMTICTDNAAASKHNTASYVTTSVDYLPLLAEFEIFGARTFANQYEQNNQTQYAYYSAGNSKVKYKHFSTSTTALWWGRSPYYSGASSFCVGGTGGAAGNYTSRGSTGLAPMFLVGGVTPEDKPYLTFSSTDGEFSIATANNTKGWDGTLEYSTDASTWSVWDGTSSISSYNRILYLRGRNNSKMVNHLSDSNYLQSASNNWTCTGTNISINGNIENILDYSITAAGGHPFMEEYCFLQLFSAFGTALVHVPKLGNPAISTHCYTLMFDGCTNIQNNIDFSHVTYVASCSLSGISSKNIIFSATLKYIEDNCWIEFEENGGVGVNRGSEYHIYYTITDNETPPSNISNIIPNTNDGIKGTLTTYFYTDNTTVKDIALGSASEDRIINVYHLDGSEWT